MGEDVRRKKDLGTCKCTMSSPVSAQHSHTPFLTVIFALALRVNRTFECYQAVAGEPQTY